MVGERGLRAPAGTRPSGRCVRNVVSLTPGANRLRRCSSSFIQAKKNLSLQTGFLNMVGERGLGLLRKPPSGRCIRNVVSLTPGANRLLRFSSSFIQAKKTCLCRQVS
ncbi:hypothetical protein SAMN03097719_3807 [Pantoea ananatis]|nr:hypothetical protein SAMN03097719_3807 [Pantoea ananatis]